MVHDKVHAQADPLVMAFVRQLGELFHRAQLRLYLSEIRHRITAVRSSLRRIEERHQVDIVYITFLQVWKLLLHAPKIPGEIVNIHHHAEHVSLSVPFAGFLPLCIQLFQFLRSLVIVPFHLTAEFREHIVVPVQLHIEPSELVVVTP